MAVEDIVVRCVREDAYVYLKESALSVLDADIASLEGPSVNRE